MSSKSRTGSESSPGPSQRVQMLSRHISTSPRTSATTPSNVQGFGNEPPVVHTSNLGIRTLKLNRPKALNALNGEMINLMKPLLENWERSKTCDIIILKGEGRAFCAGGDVVCIVKAARDPKTRSAATDFFKQEYELDRFIAHMKKPVITFMDGVTMGGGVGLSVHAAFRIATEKTVFAMPETTIGLFPDVGANFFLPRLDGQLGVYLGLTSDQLKGYGVYQAGIATHFVPSDRLSALEERLSGLQFAPDAPSTSDKGIALINAAIEEFSGDHDASTSSSYDLVHAKRAAIDTCFAPSRAEEITKALQQLEKTTLSSDDAGNRLAAWAKKTRETIEARSPTSVKVALEGIRRGASLSIDQVFDLDMHLANVFCNPDIAPDFVNGVTHVLIEKKNKPDADGKLAPAPWSPATLSEVTTQHIRDTFFPKAELTSPPESYKEYPHASLALPSERLIGRVIQGNMPDSSAFAPTEKEVHAWFEREWKGKVGVTEKVAEVISRRTSMQSDGSLKWKSSSGNRR